MAFKKLFAASLMAASALCIGAAQSEIIFQLGNNPQPGEQNIFFDSPESGTLITGEVGHTGIPVQFASTQTLFQSAQGQASISGSASRPDTVLLTNISVMVPGYTFQDFIFNLQSGTGAALVTAVDNFNATFQYTLGSGENFLTVLAQPGSGESIESISVAMLGSGGFLEFKQPRISGVAATTRPLAEPGSLATLATVLFGIAVTAKRGRARGKPQPSA